jgi:aminopeptidase
VIDAAKYARLLCDWCLRPEPGDQVVVSTTSLAADAVLALQRELLEREAFPLLRVSVPGQSEGFWAAAGDAQLDAHAPIELVEAETTQASVRIEAPANTRALAGVDPARIARLAMARRAVREAAMQRRWCVSIWPTAALAQQAGMGTAQYAAFVERALFLDRDDPVAAWQELSARQAELVERLTPVREIRIEAPGTDLRLDVTGRTWINSDGHRNMPSGEVFTGPVETSAEGRVRFSIPTAPAGVDVAGVELEFRAGRVVSASAERGEDYLRTMLATDEGASLLGELGIGTNRGIDRATGEILLDEKIGGTVHLAIGRSYPETGGTNVSAVHWDLICDLRDGGRLTADGQVIEV